MIIFSRWLLLFLIASQIKNNNKKPKLVIIGFRLIAIDCWIKKGLDFGSSPPNHTIWFLKTLLLTIFTSWRNFMIKWPLIQNIYLKINSTSWTKGHHDIIIFEVRRLISNTKNYISQERKMNCPWIRWIPKLCLKN